MDKCLNCSKKLDRKIDSFCKRCEAELSWEQKEHLLSGEVDKAINNLGNNIL